MSIPTLASEPDLVRPLPELHYEREFNVVKELVDRHVREGHGDDPALLYEDETITYAELRRRVTAFGNALSNLGVEPGDSVVTRLSNRPEAVVSCLAIQRIGAVAVPTMELLREAEFTIAVTDTDAVAVVVDDLVDEIADCLPTLESVEEVVVVGDDVDVVDARIGLVRNLVAPVHEVSRPLDVLVGDERLVELVALPEVAFHRRTRVVGEVIRRALAARLRREQLVEQSLFRKRGRLAASLVGVGHGDRLVA
jgi:hypothetical protein